MVTFVIIRKTSENRMFSFFPLSGHFSLFFHFHSPLSLQILRMNPIFRNILKAGRPLQTMLTSSSQFALPSFTSPALFQTTRGFAAAAPKKGKKPVAAPVEEKKKSESLIPINIFVGMNSTFILMSRWKGPRSSPRWSISWLVVAHACSFSYIQLRNRIPRWVPMNGRWDSSMALPKRIWQSRNIDLL